MQIQAPLVPPLDFCGRVSCTMHVGVVVVVLSLFTTSRQGFSISLAP